MPIYKITLIKFIKSFSTWFPLGTTLIIVLLIGAILPFSFLDLNSPAVIQTYKLYIIMSVTTIGSATSIVSATFAAYKAVQIYKQEIEEGTFLVLISKPIDRKKIIFEKWLALFTIISFYVFVVIAFYIIIVLSLDPGSKIANLNIPTISTKIFMIGSILFGIILMLTVLFSSIALILSSKTSSSATIALVAGLGAIIPITGLIPSFTNNSPQKIITTPINPLNPANIPRAETISFLDKIIKNPSITSDSVNKLFRSVDHSYKIIENNKSNKYITKLGVASGKNDIYENLFYIDFNYQISNISTIASDLLINSNDADYISTAAIVSGTNNLPTVSGKVNIVEKNISIQKLSNMMLNSLNEYKIAASKSEYTNGIFPFFDYILSVNNIVADKTNEQNFALNFEKLLPDLILNSNLSSSPLISSILGDPKISNELKNRLKNQDNPFYGEIKAIEKLILIKMNIVSGFGLNLIIPDNLVNNFFITNQIESFSTYKDANAYLMPYLNQTNDLNNIIINFFPESKTTNENTFHGLMIIRLANILLLSEKSSTGISIFAFGDYANKWILFGVYSSLAFLLIPTSYLIIRKQDIR